jgi:hypothetical protein
MYQEAWCRRREDGNTVLAEVDGVSEKDWETANLISVFWNNEVWLTGL